MKKQILILVLFVMATFANVTRSYGQCITPDALHPLAGVPYDYEISGNGGDPQTYQWIVTKSTDIIAGLASPLAAGSTTYSIATPTAAKTTITWAPELIADALTGTPYYVVVKYTGTSTANCVVENIKAFKILPINMFQLDLENIIADGTTMTGTDVCTSDIVAANITDAGQTATIAYDYGVTNIYVKVDVRNFTGAWKMSVNRDALVAAAAGDGESAKLFWGVGTADASAAATEITSDDPVTIAEQNAADATTDETIYLRLEVTHGTFEGLTGESFAFVVNAVDKADNPDVSDTCADEDDTVTQNILARPTITDETGAAGTYLVPAP